MTRYKHAGTPATEEMEALFAKLLKSCRGHEDRLAKDIVDVISEATTAKEGFHAAKLLLEEYAQDYPIDELSALAEKIILFMQEHKLKVNNVIPEKPFRFTFVGSLNPAEQSNLSSALEELQKANIIDDKHALTEFGFSRVWG